MPHSLKNSPAIVLTYVAEELTQSVTELLNHTPSELTPILHQLHNSDLQSLLQKPPSKAPSTPAAPFGDVALPCFRFAAKQLTAPTIAQTLSCKLNQLFTTQPADYTWISCCRAVGGFVNFDLQPGTLQQWVFDTFKTNQILTATIRHHYRTSRTTDQTTESFMIEYSQPNTHKEFHIGHTRNVCLGLSLSRIYQLLGHPVIQVNYIGDEGTHVAKCLWELQKQAQIQPPADYTASQWYNLHYTKANEHLETNPAAAHELSVILAELEARSGKFYQLWTETKQRCLDDFAAIYTWLGVDFDHVYFESELTTEAQAIVDEYLHKGVFHHSEGAIGCDLRDQDLGYMMVRKSDGNSLYITKDLALAHRKNTDYNVQSSLIVVGNEQNFHFQQLFACLKLMDMSPQHYEHISYGMVELKQGKMSSRKGNVVGFWELISHISTSLDQPLHQLKTNVTPDEYVQIKKQLTLGVLMFGMLSQDPQKKLVFDIDSFTQFEGRTGPYLMYAHTRAFSILSKAPAHLDLVNLKPEDDHKPMDDIEKQLMLKLTEIIDVIPRAAQQRSPALLGNYLYELCRAFSRFYTHCPIFNTANAHRQQQRLMLTQRFSVALKLTTHLIGITPPNQM